MSHSITIIACLTATALLSAPRTASAQAQGADPANSGGAVEPDALPLFAAHEPLTLRLEGDLRKLRGDRDTAGTEERPCVLTVGRPDGGADTLEVLVRTRGRYRLQRRTCDFPPLRLNFRKKGVEGTVFDGLDKLKLVAHCQDKRDEYEQFVLLEYLIYRTYNLLTDPSFRVRLARITYVDSGEKPDSLTKYAFLVEDEDHLAARHGSLIIEQPVHPAEMAREQLVLLEVFEFMIGNTDFSAVYQHNVGLMMDSTQVPMPVPYDFDWSGVINAPYARPDGRLPIRSVRDRLFRGFCRPESEYTPVFQRFNEQKDAIYALYESQTGLEPKYRQRALEYYDQFYRIINDPKAVRREIVDRCRKI